MLRGLAFAARRSRSAIVRGVEIRPTLRFTAPASIRCGSRSFSTTAVKMDADNSGPTAMSPTVDQPAPVKPLKSDNPLVWIDCEMTGLSPPADKLLQVACYITDAQLNLLEPSGFETVIARPQSLLDAMDPWCVSTHAATGLTARVLSSTTSVAAAAEALLSYIKKHVPEPQTAVLCGNSIHFDKVFLSLEMPEVVAYLYYRIGDVSSIKEFAKRWCDEEVLKGVPEKTYTHEARQDILESIEEARYYRRVLFGAKDGNSMS